MKLERKLIKTLRSRKVNPLEFNFHLTALNVSQSEAHVLNNSSTTPPDAAFLSQAVAPAGLDPRYDCPAWEVIQVHPQGFYESLDLKLRIAHFIVLAEGVVVIHGLWIEAHKHQDRSSGIVNKALN